MRDSRGAVLYADDGRLRSPVDMADPQFVRAVHGATSAQIVADGAAPGGHVVRVVGPVFALSTNRSGGVFEADLPYAAVQHAIEVQVRHTVTRLAACLALLWTALAGISFSTTRRLRRLLAQNAYEARHDQPDRPAQPARDARRPARPPALPGGAAPNGRPHLGQRATRVLVDRRRPARPHGQAAIGGAVGLLDLNGFKAVNDEPGTQRATGCCRSPPTGCATCCVRPTSSPAWAATSSACCWPTSATVTPLPRSATGWLLR
ncbi:hypothetical protein GCM10025868_26340 [Angustibacter aerolatus]|uniref:Guanylate cyclase domain-containing protein n=1 Tax=Angustibacter aerolatus TaxID=1162965 RepID=A0ABQ6JJ43_9ACTN|nr:hypothetical protein GCM10025868_26340 [Angustibacter aerolatus]